jgi:hypothetical protein
MGSSSALRSSRSSTLTAADTGFLLDLHDLYANVRNFGGDAHAMLYRFCARATRTTRGGHAREAARSLRALSSSRKRTTRCSNRYSASGSETLRFQIKP